MCYTEPNISYILQHISHVWPICIHIHFGSYGYIYSFSCSWQGLIAHSLSARPVKRPPSYQDRTSYSSIYIYIYVSPCNTYYDISVLWNNVGVCLSGVSRVDVWNQINNNKWNLIIKETHKCLASSSRIYMEHTYIYIYIRLSRKQFRHNISAQYFGTIFRLHLTTRLALRIHP